MWKQIGLLTLAMAIWGLAFVALKVAMQDFTPLWMNGLRYLMAVIVLLPVFILNRTWKKSWKELRKPLLAGVFLFLGIYIQTLGLQYTSVAKSSFITCLYVFLVPLYYSLWGKRFRKRFWFLVVMSLIGVAMLCDLKLDQFNYGDLLTLICVIFCSAHIIYVGRVANSFKSALEFNGIQCLSFGVIASVLGYMIDGPTSLAPLFDWSKLSYFSSWWAMFILAIPSGVIAFAIQVHTQKTVPAHIVSLVFLMESPFAVAFGYMILNEKLSWTALLGCLLITVAVGLVPLIEKKNLHA